MENYKDQEDAKMSAKEAKEAAKKDKVDAADAKRAARTCSVDDCFKMTRKEGGAKNWKYCKICKILFCPNHGAEYATHCLEHQTIGETVDV